MLPDLAPPLTTYFEASNAYDADALVAAFADNASVHDEGQTMVGPAAIRDWAEDSFRKYRARLTPKQISRQGDAVIVAVAVAGSFPGSPIELAFRFRIAGVKIAALEIG
jgi:ketosteroid isomerase-like protein